MCCLEKIFFHESFGASPLRNLQLIVTLSHDVLGLSEFRYDIELWAGMFNYFSEY